ncbi:fatty-acid amide hydrolase 2-A isoform X2 [Bombyx mori]|uniref:Amidase domain-containing protein n=1 Tax=Bombyx mori TaxID=7091 RepID=A0A8R2CA37_BOMMO|nr:fatty-acid amide hydrolase 2-A isoform X2 [Bombyx mori]XP_021208960.2 fatty-acid amide hydrolase 2-A isoform X2 [Bombyx mori]
MQNICMEVGVRLVGILLRFLNFILTPLFWLKSHKRTCVPPVTEPMLFKGAADLAREIRNGEITSTQVVTMYIKRIKEVNPYLNAVVEDRYRAALYEARACDVQIKEAMRLGTIEDLVKNKPLLGVPFTVKESCSLGGLSNSVGCLENAGRKATADGAAVALVRDAGAIPLLVSNTPELCLGWETTNLLTGTTNNPYWLSKTPGGSSGGEAALLASAASPFSVSSDIAGSIRVPAAFCGVYGHKPTPGIIPIEGHIPTLSDEQFPKFLTVGPMARKAEDLPLLLNVMAGENRHVLNLDEPVNIEDIEVFYMTEAMDSIALIKVDKCIQDAVLEAVQYLSRCGATVSEEKFKGLEDSVEISISVFFSMKDIPNMLQDPADPKREKNLFLEILKCPIGGASRSLQGLSFALIEKTRLFIPKSKTDFYKDKADKLRTEITRRLGARGVLLYPAHGGAAHAHGGVFPRASGVLYTMPFNILGLPAAVAPLALRRDLRRALPVCLQIIAAPNQDRLCLAVAKQLEMGFGGWRPPQ